MKRRRLPLKTLDHASRSLQRIMRMRFNDEIDSQMFRDLCYGFSQLHSFYKLQLESDFEHRLIELEDLMAKEETR